MPQVINDEQIKNAIEIFGKCTDDFLFLFDLTNDYYRISEAALERFELPGEQFSNVTEALSKIIHKDDLQALLQDLEAIKQGLKSTHNMEYRWIDRNHEDVWISCRGVLVITSEGNKQLLVGRISELGTKRKADNVTGFLTEAQCQEDFNAISSNMCEAGHEIDGYVMKIGIDHFKDIREMHGMKKVDQIVKNLAACIRQVCGEAKNIYRIGNRTFLIFYYNYHSLEEVEETYRQIINAIHHSIEQSHYSIYYSVSSGVVPFKMNDKLSYEEIQKQAEFALNMAMKEDVNGYYVFDEACYQKHIRRIDIQDKLRNGVNNQFAGFEVYYQPLIRTQQDGILGAEALLRFKCEKYGMISPMEFIPILEESGLIIPVGKWVIEQAVKQCKKWQDHYRDFYMSINLSYIQIKRCDVKEDIVQALRRNNLSPDFIVVELTESGQLESNSAVLSSLDRIREAGIKIAIDDFGTGYSNLIYLKEFHAHMLKIDHTFTRKALADPFDFRLVTHIVSLAHSIGLSVCLEGIETEEQKHMVQVLEVEYLQGYLIGKPVPVVEFERLHM